MRRRSALILGAWAILAIFLVACHAPALLGAGGGASVPVAKPGSMGQTGGMATLRITVQWPRSVQSIPPSADRISISVQVPAYVPTPPAIPDLVKPVGGALATTRTVLVPADVPIQLQATATATGSVVAQSLPLTIQAKRNEINDVPLELLPATQSATGISLLSPAIDAISPERGYPGITTVTLTGRNFGFGQGYGGVLFNAIDAGSALEWTDDGSGASGSATISVEVPPLAQNGTISVRLGSTQQDMASFVGSFSASDPWPGHFTILGSVGGAFNVAQDVMPATPSLSGYATSSAQPYGLADTLLASDGTQFWALWVASGSTEPRLECESLTPDSPHFTQALTPGIPFTVDMAPQITLGGAASFPGGLALTYAKGSGAQTEVDVVTVSSTGTASDPVQLSSTAMPANVAIDSGLYTTAQPAIARNSVGDFLAVWIDDRDAASGSCAASPRVYGAAFDSQGNYLGGGPIQYSNSASSCGYGASAVSRPTVASNGADFLVAWQEATGGWPYSIMTQEVGANGVPGPSIQNNILSPNPQIGPENPQLSWNPQTQAYGLIYDGRIGGATGTHSSLYFQALGNSGLPQVNGVTQEPVTVVDDSRSEGLTTCPSYAPGTPCGQGLRQSPQILWNGRDYMVAWEMDRDDGELDIQGARLAPDGNRAAIEPPYLGTGVGASTASIAEILYTFDPGNPHLSEPGSQFRPRIAFAGDAMMVGWLEAGASPGELDFEARLWR